MDPCSRWTFVPACVPVCVASDISKTYGPIFTTLETQVCRAQAIIRLSKTML